MTSGTFFGIVPLLLGLFAAQPGVVGQSVTRLVVQDEIILRVPVQPRPLMPEIEWIEKKGPKCIPAAAIQRRAPVGPQQVDFVLSINRARAVAAPSFDEDLPGARFLRAASILQPQDDRKQLLRRAATRSHARAYGRRAARSRHGSEQLVPTASGQPSTRIH